MCEQDNCPIPYGFCHCHCGRKTRIDRHGVPRTYCKGHSRRIPPMDRFEVDENSGCWNWTGQTSGVRMRYGYLRDPKGSGCMAMAHRVIYEMARGPIPDGLFLDHLCRNSLCVNPDHLEPVTNAQNLRRGNSTKLNWDDVRAIRRSSDSYALLSERFGVSKQQIGAIKLGKSWVAK